MTKENNNNHHKILKAINDFANETEQRFEKIDQRFDKVDQRFDKIESKMVTKDYLDEKLADLRGDLVVLIRKEDNKVKKLVEVLKRRKIISEAESKEVLAMEPFSQTYS